MAGNLDKLQMLMKFVSIEELYEIDTKFMKAPIPVLKFNSSDN